MGRTGLDGEAAVFHQTGSLGPARGDAVMADDDEGEPQLVPQLLQERHDLVPGAFVEVAGRLVGQQHGGLLDQRAGDGDPLLLPSGQLRGQEPGPLAETHVNQGAQSALLPFGGP